jgi:hypothetical protein
MTITGHRVREIIHAISLLKAYPNEISSGSTWDWQLRFYQGTNCLGIADFQGKAVVCDGREYPDETGTLEKLHDDLLKQTTPPEDR